MFKRLINKKGLIAIQIAWLSVAFIMSAISFSPSVRASFQNKKANIMCEQGYKNVSCQEIQGMSKAEILSYIKDDIEVLQFVMRPRLGG